MFYGFKFQTLVFDLTSAIRGYLSVKLQILKNGSLHKWWWREVNEPNAKWKTVVRICHSSRRRIGSKKGVWNRIKHIDRELADMGINIRSFLRAKADGSCWIWTLDLR